jgi:hypothetical protein
VEVREPDVMSERLEMALRSIDQQLGALVASQKAHGRELAEIKARVKETNGRVTALEAREIAERAALDERRRIDGEHGEQEVETRTRRDRTRDRLIAAVVTLASVGLGAVLADIRFF